MGTGPQPDRRYPPVCLSPRSAARGSSDDDACFSVVSSSPWQLAYSCWCAFWRVSGFGGFVGGMRYDTRRYAATAARRCDPDVITPIRDTSSGGDAVGFCRFGARSLWMPGARNRAPRIRGRLLSLFVEVETLRRRQRDIMKQSLAGHSELCRCQYEPTRSSKGKVCLTVASNRERLGVCSVSPVRCNVFCLFRDVLTRPRWQNRQSSSHFWHLSFARLRCRIGTRPCKRCLMFVRRMELEASNVYSATFRLGLIYHPSCWTRSPYASNADVWSRVPVNSLGRPKRQKDSVPRFHLGGTMSVVVRACFA
ncbi:hypothetical protein C8Q73DRAFT_195134 [Cubamyces lactineus]|nr:hypothetical protein C8Q73DRAFT_195134 [Cubamyces lactineus]